MPSKPGRKKDAPFDIHQRVVNEYGEVLEKAASKYQEQLLELFAESPEGQALLAEGVRPGHWTSIVIDFGLQYLELTPAQMSPADLRELLFEIIPTKLTTVPEAAPQIIHESQALWNFMQREFHLQQATACLKLLDDKAVHRLQKELSNPANFGMAKSFMMMGLEQGFDMTTEEGVNKWMETYNAQIAGSNPFGPPRQRSAGPLKRFIDSIKILGAKETPSLEEPDWVEGDLDVPEEDEIPQYRKQGTPSQLGIPSRKKKKRKKR